MTWPQEWMSQPPWDIHQPTTSSNRTSWTMSPPIATIATVFVLGGWVATVSFCQTQIQGIIWEIVDRWKDVKIYTKTGFWIANISTPTKPKANATTLWNTTSSRSPRISFHGHLADHGWSWRWCDNEMMRIQKKSQFIFLKTFFVFFHVLIHIYDFWYFLMYSMADCKS